jgi:Ran GTPase-activating protein (RanGAP) involved in mRNA processing and transport
MIEDSYSLLKTLNLEGNKIGDKALITICNKTHFNNSLKVINVSNNLITCDAMEAFGDMIKYATLNAVF